jgi:hypothetical protein
MELINSDNILLKDFYKLIEIYQKDIPRYEKEIEILLFLYPDETEDTIIDQPLSFIDKVIQSVFNGEGVIHPSVTINDIEYTLKGNPENFELSYKQYNTFEKNVINGNQRYIHNLMADIYVNATTTYEERCETFLNELKLEYITYFIMLLPNIIDEKFNKK